MLILKQNNHLLFGSIAVVSVMCLLSPNRRKSSLCCCASYLYQKIIEKLRLGETSGGPLAQPPAQRGSNNGCGFSSRNRNSMPSLSDP